MALTQAEKRQIIDMLDRMERSRIEATLRSENSFLKWLKRAAWWLFDAVSQSIVGKIVGRLWSIFFG